VHDEHEQADDAGEPEGGRVDEVVDALEELPHSQHAEHFQGLEHADVVGAFAGEQLKGDARDEVYGEPAGGEVVLRDPPEVEDLHLTLVEGGGEVGDEVDDEDRV